jgi:hypothetical protein
MENSEERTTFLSGKKKKGRREKNPLARIVTSPRTSIVLK